MIKVTTITSINLNPAQQNTVGGAGDGMKCSHLRHAILQTKHLDFNAVALSLNPNKSIKNIYWVRGQRWLTCKGGGVSKGSDLWVRQAREERDNRVHHVFIIDDTVLTLTNQNTDKFTEVITELLPLRPGDGERVITAILKHNASSPLECEA